MRAALLALAACQLAPVQPLRYVQPAGTHSEGLSNIQLLIPLLMGEPERGEGGERDYLEDRGERDDHDDYGDSGERYSSIPAYAFTLDERQEDAPRMRSAYLQDEEDGRGAWSACGQLGRASSLPARQALLYLCLELLDTAPPAPPPCACCTRARRDLVPMGDNSDLVQRYLHAPRKKRRSPWLME